LHAPPHSAFPERNRLLRALPRAEYRALLPDLEAVSLVQGQVLFEARAPITHVYFPQRCVVSLLAKADGEPGAEAALVGNEGVAGLSVFLGAKTSPLQAVLQVPDHAWRMKVAGFRRAIAASARLRTLLQSYTQTLISQIAQSVLCNQRHTVDARCARWLLMAHDRVGVDQFLLTQEFLSQMLGVRRPTVSVAAGVLQRVGLIEYTRGRIRIIDRRGLEAAACTCYATVEADYAAAFS
jgi:CRP-like cAMP-binding protein